MTNTRGVVLMTFPEDVAQRVDHFAVRLQLTPEDMVIAFIVAATNQIEAGDERMLRFLRDYVDHKHREYEAGLLIAAKRTDD